MKKQILALVSLFCSVMPLWAQHMPLVIKATNPMVDIKADGTLLKADGTLLKAVWRISPEANPDVYTTSADTLTFYTNIDSISFRIKPNVQYDFVVLLNEKDSAHTRIVWEPKKLDILKKAEAYNTADNRVIPQFTYQAADNPNLVRIRKELKLDSIAGQGDELSKIFSLLHWMHNTVRHDGASTSPEKKNTLDLISVCQTENRGINCRMMAIALNECYLSMGIKSRYITCMPRETEFNDCHVINMVYSTDLKKWIWIDPTFDAYVMDESGELLGIQEVRERLIQNKPLIVNPDANWNHQQRLSKDYYLDFYMAKNLYRLETPAESGYDTETRIKGKEIVFVELLPLDGLVQTPQKDNKFNKEYEVKYTYYKTNNPNLFWAKPE